ncbi:MAG: hypothetical protein Kow0090_21010 [Myxococcota bacterium]
MNQSELTNSFLELITKTSTELPGDVLRALERACENEAADSPAQRTLKLMQENAKAAKQKTSPLCQDTGTIIFYVDYGPEFNERELRKAIREAVAKATELAVLRPNTAEPLSGKNAGNNLGSDDMPYIHFTPHDEKGLFVKLALKGGGSENVSAQYSLPDRRLGAGRDINGVKKCILDATLQAQGLGCAPGTIGVGVGGDRMGSHIVAKEQLFRRLDDVNEDPVLAAAEAEMLEKLNRLQIGPMGFGGKNTVLGVKIGTIMRHPASFFVSIAYMCWAFRRKKMEIKDGKTTIFD